MTQAAPKLLTCEEFLNWYPNDGRRYELHRGVIVEMPPPTGPHEGVVGFLALEIAVEAKKLERNLRIPKTAFVKTPNNDSSYSPDILLLNYNNIAEEPFANISTVSNAVSVPLVVEVVSTNWRDDYYDKFGNYEEMGILEYWIVDYAAYGGRKFIGAEKYPTFFVCELINDEYEITAFRGNDLIISPTFPQLKLTAQEVFNAASC
ncbi:MAG: Uma2 family endonuclease [Calothrix sp. SM1_7_51]|nr:Uma2 family endonuclease [Calothrix sp. SM1_7_51]